MKNQAIKEKIANIVDMYFTVKETQGPDKLNQALDELIQVFGDCTKCFGKGYSTNYVGTDASADSGGDRGYVNPLKINVTPCNCHRGKQVRKLFLADER